MHKNYLIDDQLFDYETQLEHHIPTTERITLSGNAKKSSSSHHSN